MGRIKVFSYLLVLVMIVGSFGPIPVYGEDNSGSEPGVLAQSESPDSPGDKTESSKNKDKQDSKESSSKKDKEEDDSVTGISINKSAITLKIGSKENLSAQVSPSSAKDKTISWKSSDESVATVDEKGEVTAKAVGEAKITVTSKDGGLTASCQVKVTETDSKDIGENATAKEEDSTSGEEASSEKASSDDDSSSKKSTKKKANKKKSISRVKAKSNSNLSAYRTSLADGTYTDFEFTWAGGTGKARLNLEKVTVKDGIASGVFTSSSENMTHVYYAGHTDSDTDNIKYYDPDSDTCGQDVEIIKNQRVTFPVKINKATKIACRTTAMSVPHWVNYEYTIKIEEPKTCKVTFKGEDEDGAGVDLTLTVKDSSGKTLTADKGAYTLEMDKSYQVKARADGYETWEETVSPSQDGETITLIMTARSFLVNVKAKDKDSKKEISGARVVVTDEKTGAAVSPSGGSYSLPGNHTYTIIVYGGDDYEDAKKEKVTVSKDTTIEIDLKAIDAGSAKQCKLTAAVTDEEGKTITDPKIEVVKETGEGTLSVKETDGKYLLTAGKNYTVTVSADGYEPLSKVVCLTSDKTESFVLKKADIRLHIRVIDPDTQYNLSKAEIKIEDDAGKTYQAENETVSLPFETTVTITASCSGYSAKDGSKEVSKTVKITKEETVTLELVKKTFSVKVTCIDADTEKEVEGASIKVTNSDSGKTVEPSGGAYPMTWSSIYSIEASASGYAPTAMTHKATADTTLTLSLTKNDSSGSGEDSSSGNNNKKEQVVDNGTYNIKFKDAENSMFNVVGAVLHVKDGKYTADISLSGKGYDYVYPSTAKAAKKAGKKKWSKYWVNKKGQYTYTIEVPYLDKPFILASRSIKYAKDSKMKDQAWRDGLESGGSHGSHEIILYSKYTNGKPLPTHEGTRKPSSIDAATDSNSEKTSAGNKKTQKQKNYTSNTGGSTGSVNNTTGLKDGEYKPDSFSFSGGTGKVRITCDKIIVKGGKTYARITFSSTYFQYVKAGGQKITNYTRTSSSTSFVIPVELNKNNKILGMTTKMSQPHEIAYTLYIGLKAAANAQGAASGTGTGEAGGEAGTTSGKVDDQYDKLDPQAPEIIGLTYQKEMPVPYSDKIKIYQYADGFYLVELDVRKGTALDESITGIRISTADEDETVNKVEDVSTQPGGPAAGAADEEAVPKEKTASEMKAALYDNAIYKYLIVPQGATVPAGIEKQLFVVQLPADKTVVTSAKALKVYDQLGIGSQIMGIGVKEEDIPVDSFKAAMKASGSQEPAILDIGSYDKLDYKKLLLHKANVLIESADILPHLGDLEGYPQKSPQEFASLSQDEKENFRTLTREQALKLKKIGMRGVQLGMGVIVDRSTDEETALGKAEWLKIYGLLYGKTQEAEAMYQAVVDNATDQEKTKAAAIGGSGKEQAKDQ